jgi:hypothetical protein
MPLLLLRRRAPFCKGPTAWEVNVLTSGDHGQHDAEDGVCYGEAWSRGGE